MRWQRALWTALLGLIQDVPVRPLPDTMSLLEVERAMLGAEVRGDSALFRALELCRFRFVGCEGEELTKAEDVAAVGQPRRGRVVAFGVDEVIVRRYGRTSLVWGRDTMVVEDRQGNRRVTRSRFTHVFVQHGGV
jgi:hypothetical protein